MTSKNDPATMSDDAIRQRAYLMWEADGRPEGMAEHYWMRAAAPDGTDRPKAAKARTDKISGEKPASGKDVGKSARKKAASAAAAKPAGKSKAAAVKLSAPAVKAKVASKPPSRKPAKKD